MPVSTDASNCRIGDYDTSEVHSKVSRNSIQNGYYSADNSPVVPPRFKRRKKAMAPILQRPVNKPTTTVTYDLKEQRLFKRKSNDSSDTDVGSICSFASDPTPCFREEIFTDNGFRGEMLQKLMSGLSLVSPDISLKSNSTCVLENLQITDIDNLIEDELNGVDDNNVSVALSPTDPVTICNGFEETHLDAIPTTDDSGNSHNRPELVNGEHKDLKHVNDESDEVPYQPGFVQKLQMKYLSLTALSRIKLPSALNNHIICSKVGGINVTTENQRDQLDSYSLSLLSYPREDIEIIESPRSSCSTTNEDIEIGIINEHTSNSVPVIDDEMPKPNTVSKIKDLFEQLPMEQSTSSSSSSNSSISPDQTEQSVTGTVTTFEKRPDDEISDKIEVNNSTNKQVIDTLRTSGMNLVSVPSTVVEKTLEREPLSGSISVNNRIVLRTSRSRKDVELNIPVTDIDDLLIGDSLTKSGSDLNPSSPSYEDDFCFEFIGANVQLEKSSLANRTSRQSSEKMLRFDDAVVTHEYPAQTDFPESDDKSSTSALAEERPFTNSKLLQASYHTHGGAFVDYSVKHTACDYGLGVNRSPVSADILPPPVIKPLPDIDQDKGLPALPSSELETWSETSTNTVDMLF